MDKRIVEMRAQRATLVNEARQLHDKSVAEAREFTAEEQTQYDRIMADVDSLKAKIDREERLLDEASELEKREGSVGREVPGDETRGGDSDKEKEYRQAFTRFMVGGNDALTPEQRAMIAERRALSTTGGSGSQGGYTIPEGFYNEIIQAMKEFGGMREVARVLPTASGNSLMIPTANNTAAKGRILAENAQINSSDPSFAQTSLGAFKYTSDLVLVPIELIQDSAFDLEAYIRGILADRIARITNEHFTVGDGSLKPAGIVTASSAGATGATGQTTSVTYDDLVDLEHSIDPAYRRRSRFMFHDTTLKALKKLKDADGRPLWVPGVAVREPDTILGYNYTINQDMPVMAANAKSILFGDLGSYWIRDVMGIELVRFGEKYMDYAQIGFTAFSRHDGKFINAGGNQIKHYANSAT